MITVNFAKFLRTSFFTEHLTVTVSRTKWMIPNRQRTLKVSKKDTAAMSQGCTGVNTVDLKVAFAE